MMLKIELPPFNGERRYQLVRFNHIVKIWESQSANSTVKTVITLTDGTKYSSVMTKEDILNQWRFDQC